MELAVTQCAVNLLIGLVLTESVDGPDGGGYPAEKRDLQEEAHDAGEGAADGEERQPGKDESDEQSHECVLSAGVLLFLADVGTRDDITALSGGVEEPAKIRRRERSGHSRGRSGTLLTLVEPRDGLHSERPSLLFVVHRGAGYLLARRIGPCHVPRASLAVS